MTSEPKSGEEGLSPLKRAYLAIQALEDKVVRAESASREPIAIVGIGCRFPGGANSPEAFRALLRAGEQALHAAPPDDRKSYRRNRDDVEPALAMPPAGFIDEDVGGFDPQFFNISPREAAGIDPQQRLLLEIAWEALEDAAESPASLYESRTGVYVGICGNDYAQLMIGSGDTALLDSHLTSGIGHSVASGRLSYFLGLQGPSISIDTACSSSLVATHLACVSLRAGESTLAIAGGVNLILDSNMTVSFLRGGMLSGDGRCKSFADRADGFGRGEGCGLVVLKTLSQAVADGNRIYAVIRGTAVNQDGPSSALSAPNGPAQTKVIEAALRDAGIGPAQVDYIEAHGTGTELGDPIEARALDTALSVNGSRARPVLVGSVKTNLGHLESAAGIAGLIKLALSIEDGWIPRHLNFDRPSRHIPWGELALEVVSDGRAWPETGEPRRGGVSSFGYSGTNCHIVLEQGPGPADRDTAPQSGDLALLVLSAATSGALSQLAAKYREKLAGVDDDLALNDICYTSRIGRSHLNHRVGFVAPANDMSATLDSWLRDGWAVGATGGRVSGEAPSLAFAFTGQGSQYAGMAMRLYRVSSNFRELLDECAPVFEQATGRELVPLLEDAGALSGTRYSQPALFAIEWSIAEMLRRLGVRPAALFGHSLGEYVAAALAGVWSVADGLRLTALRGRLMHERTKVGAMLALEADESTVVEMISEIDDRLSVAAVNGPKAVVVSGETSSIQRCEERATALGVRVTRLGVDRAFHSALMDPILDEFEAAVQQLSLRPPKIRIVSALTGGPVAPAEITSSSYWRRHLRGTVRFADAAAAIAQRHRVVVEIGTHRVLSVFPHDSAVSGLTWIGTLRKGEDDRVSVLQTLQCLYAEGVELNFEAMEHAGARRVALPRYPFQRKHYWFSAQAAGQTVLPRGADSGHPLVGYRLDSPLPGHQFESRISHVRHPFVADHRVAGGVIMPAAGFLEAAAFAGAATIGGTVVVRNLELDRMMVVAEDQISLMQTIVAEQSGDGALVQFFSRPLGEASAWTRHASATVSIAAAPSVGESSVVDLAELRARCPVQVAREAFYRGLADRGLAFGAALHGVAEAWCGRNEAVARIRLPEKNATGIDRYLAHPALIDACLQTIALALGDSSAKELYLPVNIGEFRILETGCTEVYACAEARFRRDSNDLVEASVTAFDAEGRRILEIGSLLLQRTDPSLLRELIDGQSDSCLYFTDWEAQTRAGRAVGVVDEWLDGLPADLSRRASEQGVDAYEVFFEQFEGLCVEFVASALIELGYDGNRSGQDVSALAESLGVIPRHYRLFARFLDILEIEAVDLRQCRKDSSGHSRDRIVDRLAELSRSHPEAGGEIALVRRCGPQLAEALRGRCDPLELLFPGGSLADAERLYGDSPLAVVFNESIADAVQAAARAGTQLRVLEIGGGTGGTTRHVLDRGIENLDYTFTDVSGLFVARAAKRFEDFGRASFRELDIERDPVDQGFETGAYDVVLASNVLHACEDLRSTLGYVRRLLAPGGILVAFEVFEPHHWFDLTVGLTPGWWKFSDAEIRPDYPALDADGWQRVLADVGFSGVRCYRGDPDGSGVLSRQGIVVAGASQPQAEASGDYLILGQDGGYGRILAERLNARGQNARLVALAAPRANGAVSCLEPGLFEDSTTPPAGIVFLGGLEQFSFTGAKSTDMGTAQLSACRDALHLLQEAVRHDTKDVPPIWLVTRGAQSVTGDELVLDPAQATIWGLCRSVDLEHPGLRVYRVDLDPSTAHDQTDALIDLLLAPTAERETAVRDGQIRVPRLRPFVPASAGDVDEAARVLKCRETGSFDALVFEPAAREEPASDQIELRVEATALNFKDVLNVLGLYPGDPGALGSECAGTVIRVGSGVTGLAPGDRAMCYFPGSFARFLTVPARRAARVPDGMSIEEAASVPIAYLTALFALRHLGQIRSGDRVLIHAAAGGVGLAAVAIAQKAGAEVYATAGTPDKRRLLRDLGVQFVYDSRTLEFAKTILHDTDGQGVNLVLNSLADEFIDRSFDVVAAGGRFLELGKRGIWSPERVAGLGRPIDYHVIDWGETAEQDPELLDRLYAQLLADLESGDLLALPFRTFPSERIADAFRHMAQGRHVGKILIRYGSSRGADRSIGADGVYVVVGGLSGLGLVVAEWLADRGARRLELFGRRAPDADARARIAALQASGVTVGVSQADVADQAAIRKLLADIRERSGPIRGVVQSAGVLDDGVLDKQTWQRFQTVFAPKVAGTLHLHAATLRDRLDFFVLFSSMASVLGSAGQANHAAANAFMDVLAASRRGRGLPGNSINWGPWAEIGAAVRHGVVERGAGKGLRALAPEQGLAILGRLLQVDAAQVAAASIDWPVFLAEQDARLPFFEHLHSLSGQRPDILDRHPEQESGWLDQLESMPVRRRDREVLQFVKAQVARLLGLSVAELESDRPLSELGMDSLLAVEIRNVLGKAFGLSLPATVTFDHPSVDALSAYLSSRVFATGQDKEGGDSERAEDHSVDDIASMSDDDLDRLIAEKLNRND